VSVSETTAAPAPAEKRPPSRICGSQGVDTWGCCKRCGLYVDTLDDPVECPPGFLEAK
jgi:hypothetical protein